MREFKHKGKTYRLTEKEYVKLLKRFDVRKAVMSGGMSHIEVNCLCAMHDECGGCGLGLAKKNHPSNCSAILISMFGNYNGILCLGSLRVTWWTADTRATDYLTAVRDALLTLGRGE